jgi:hypothetical protein
MSSITVGTAADYNAFRHLPNIAHIVEIFKFIEKHHKIWASAWNESWGSNENAASDLLRRMARFKTVTLSVFDANLRDRAWVLIWNKISKYPCSNDIYNATSDAILALASYNDSIRFLEMPSEQLHFHAILSEDPAAILLLPAVIAFEKINELEKI